MSAFGGKADIIQGMARCPLIAKSGHCDHQSVRTLETLNRLAVHRDDSAHPLSHLIEFIFAEMLEKICSQYVVVDRPHSFA